MNIEGLRKDFQEILELEERARHFYNHYISQLDDERIKKILISIRNDEIKHIEIAKKLITLTA